MLELDSWPLGLSSAVSISADDQQSTLMIVDIPSLPRGHTLRIQAETGGYMLESLIFERVGP